MNNKWRIAVFAAVSILPFYAGSGTSARAEAIGAGNKPILVSGCEIPRTAGKDNHVNGGSFYLAVEGAKHVMVRIHQGRSYGSWMSLDYHEGLIAGANWGSPHALPYPTKEAFEVQYAIGNNNGWEHTDSLMRFDPAYGNPQFAEYAHNEKGQQYSIRLGVCPQPWN